MTLVTPAGNRLLSAALLLLASGCATSISTLQTARPVEPKHFQITGGAGVYAPLGSVGQVVAQGLKQSELARKAAQEGAAYQLSEEDQQQLLTAGIGLAVLTPSFGYELSARTGLVRDLDVGLRYNFTSLRLDAKYRLAHQGNGAETLPPSQISFAERADPPPQQPPSTRSFDVAVGLGVSRYFFSNPVFSVLEYVQLDDFSRWDLEVPVYLSAEFGEVFKVYGAPKYVYSRTSLDEKLVNYSATASNLSGFDVALPAEVHSHFIGASGGIAVGYRWVHLMLELTGGYTLCDPVVFGKRRSLGGVTLQPAAALNVRY